MPDTESLAPATPGVATETTDPATRAFSASMVISGIRCLLTYVVFPWILPLVGFASGVGPAVGIGVGVVAIGFNVASIRRFWIPRHRWRWWITALNASVIVLLLVLLAVDISDLMS